MLKQPLSLNIVRALAIVAGIALGATAAQAAPITSITRSGTNVALDSVTVGSFTATVSALANGTSSGPGCIDPGNSDDFILSTATKGCNPQTIDLRNLLGPSSLYRDVNGAGFDIFIFELGGALGQIGDEVITIQAILAGSTLGNGITIGMGTSFWGDTGHDAENQDIVGLALRMTDLLDGSGNPLTNASLIEGLQINRGSGGLDPTSISVFVGDPTIVPEPSTLSLVLMALGGLGLSSRRMRG